jgi:UDP-GlcNAc3NAcA epimerase
VNRIISDKVSNLLFCPTQAAVENLRNEGITNGVKQVGDVMYDVALHFGQKAREKSTLLTRLGLKPGSYVLATCHRAENTDDIYRLSEICRGLAAIAIQAPVVLPIHPRTRKMLLEQNLLAALGNVTLVEPIPYLDMVALEQSACAILTDSGGVQKEAFFFEVPCITFRDETEWVETLDGGWNQLVGADAAAIARAFANIAEPRPQQKSVFGQGNTASAILSALLEPL